MERRPGVFADDGGLRPDVGEAVRQFWDDAPDGSVAGGCDSSAASAVSAVSGVLVGPVVDTVTGLVMLDVDTAGRGELADALASIAQAEACLMAARLQLVGRLELVSSTVEFDVVAAERVDLPDGARIMLHAEVMRRYPRLTAAVADGRAMAWVPREVSAARSSLPAKLRAEFDQLEDTIVFHALACSRRGFADALRGLADDILRRNGQTRRQRQRAAIRCRTWTGRDTGMSHLSAVLDPDRGAVLTQRIDLVVRQLLADPTALDGHGPLPDDPRERTSYLQAIAFYTLMTGGGPGVAKPEIIVVVDARAESCDPDGRPAIDTGTDLVLHRDTLIDLLRAADIYLVEADNNQPLAADNVRNRRRNLRHASSQQRRLLRAIHPTCAVPGCGVPFRRTHLHHLNEWEHGGPTDLDNLTPLCPHHHTWLHTIGGWLTIHPDRSHTLHLPDGTTHHWPAPTRHGHPTLAP